MDLISTIITGFFVALLIAATLFFGMTLLMIILVTAGLITAATIIRQLWLRWRFEHGAVQREKESVTVIEAEYTEIKKRDE